MIRNLHERKAPKTFNQIKKMKQLLLILVMLTALNAKSQSTVYHPFPEDSASWVTDNYSNFCFGYCASGFYEMKGDTLLNAQTYHKLYVSGGSFYYISYPVVPNPGVVGASFFYSCNYTGAIRQDSLNKKVYFIDANMTSDTLLYDFNLALGDTVRSWYMRYTPQWLLIVSGIDSILINGNYHKRFTLYEPNLGQTSLIEGVGWADDLLGAVISGDHASHVACFNGTHIDNWLAFNNECAVPLSCAMFTSIDKQNQDKSFTLFPNPFSDQLKCTISNTEQSEISIYDIASRKIIQQQFVHAVSLNTTQLAKGLYLYEVKSKEGWCRKGKVVTY